MTEGFDEDGALDWQGTMYKTMLYTDASGGHISVTDSLSPPCSGPPRHIHHDADETFVLITGKIGFWLDWKTRVCGADSSFLAERRIPFWCSAIRPPDIW